MGLGALSVLIKDSGVGVSNDLGNQHMGVVCWHSFQTQEDAQVLLVPASCSITYTLLISILNVSKEL